MKLKPGFYTNTMTSGLYILYPDLSVDYWSVVLGEYRNVKYHDQVWTHSRLEIYLGEL